MKPIIKRFVLHFGEMGSLWGINRTVGQMYALLYLSQKPLNADDLVQALQVSRSNVSVGLKELQSWKLIRLVHYPQDRRDYFTTPEDVWQIFKTLIEEKRRREVEPTLSMLRDTLLVKPEDKEEQYAQERIHEMHELIDLASNWFDDVQKLSPETLAKLMKLGSKVNRLLETMEKLKIGGSKSS